MGVSVEVNRNNFVSEVVEASYQRPILVDFFAQWCGPCQLLKPTLEKLAQEYDFVLAKIDIDQNSELANAYKVEGVPDVRIVSQGQMYQGFVGVLPEPQIRQLLSQLNLKSELEAGLEAAQRAIATGDSETARDIFVQLAEQYPQNPKVAIATAQFLIRQDRFGEAERLLASIQEQDREFSTQAEALSHLMQLKLDSEKPPEHDLDPAFFQAVQRTLAEEYEAALQGFLAIVTKDRQYRNDGARKAMLTIFALLGDDHPLTRQYRKQLTLTLF